MPPIKKDLNQYNAFLSKLLIFANVDKNDLQKLFTSMHIHQFHKGKMMSFNPEDHANLYINYEGLFKLSKVDERGKEAILKICDKNCIVSPMHFSPYCEVSMDFVKDTTLLCFSKKDINHLIENNHQFTRNMIDFLGSSIQEMLLMVELLQIKNTKEKVGWYLLLSKIDHNLTLPYSKSLISNFLGIKPESFSRALNELRQEGIDISNKKIKLKNGDELCKYCDKITGARCNVFLSKKCIHNPL